MNASRPASASATLTASRARRAGRQGTALLHDWLDGQGHLGDVDGDGLVAVDPDLLAFDHGLRQRITLAVRKVPQRPRIARILPKMDTSERVEAYFASQPEPKQTDLRRLYALMQAEFPEGRLWFNDGTNEDGKVVANPNVGYGVYTITYADGSSREFYRIGLSANTTGISVYVLGLDDKTYLARTFGASIGKARVTGYCIKFKRLSDINADALQAAIRHGMTIDQTGGAQA
jgi:hypothetical protein